MASHKTFQAIEMPQIVPKGHFLRDKEEEFKNGTKIEYWMHRMIFEVFLALRMVENVRHQ